MRRSTLLQLARDSIQEVFEARNIIDKKESIQTHPLLNESVNVTLNLYIDKELQGSYTSQNKDSLLGNIIVSAKKAAFEDKETPILTTSAYLHCEIELILFTPEGNISEIDPAIIKGS